METNQVRNLVVTGAVVAATAGSAFAHPGHGDASFSAGLAHPFLGVDHLLAMGAIGAWAGQRGGRALWAFPVAATVAAALGGALGVSSGALPGVEEGIVASVVVLGLAVALAARVRLGGSLLLVGAAALIHGHAHGAELPSAAACAPYVAGFVLTTAALIAAAAALTSRLASRGHARVLRGAGAIVTLCGIALAFAAR